MTDSYLQGTLPDHQQAIFSFWFRVPQAVVTKVNASSYAGYDQGGQSISMSDIIPLISWGTLHDALGVTSVVSGDPGSPSPIYTYFGFPTCGFVQTGTFTSGGGYSRSWLPDQNQKYTYGPSFIGLNCQQASRPGTPSNPDPQFVIRLQTNQPAKVVDYRTTSNSLSTYARWGQYSPFYGCSPGQNEFYYVGFNGPFTRIANPKGAIISTFGFSDVGSTTYPEAQAYVNFTPSSVPQPQGSKLKTIKADQWHHVLMSYDTTGSVAASGTYYVIYDNFVDTSKPSRTDRTESVYPATVNSSVTLSLAIDDENIVGDQLRDPCSTQATSIGIIEMGPNNIVTSDAYKITYTGVINGVTHAANTPFGNSDTITSATPGPSTISFAGGRITGTPFAVPITSQIIGRGCNIEIAGLQIWLGKTCDTSQQDIRRLFIDSKGNPVPPQPSKDKFGPPTLRFWSTKDWQTGNDLGVDPGATGPFVPHHPIDGFKPLPSLHGAQEPQVVTPDPFK